MLQASLFTNISVQTFSIWRSERGGQLAFDCLRVNVEIVLPSNRKRQCWNETLRLNDSFGQIAYNCLHVQRLYSQARGNLTCIRFRLKWFVWSASHNCLRVRRLYCHAKGKCVETNPYTLKCVPSWTKHVLRRSKTQKRLKITLSIWTKQDKTCKFSRKSSFSSPLLSS